MREEDMQPGGEQAEERLAAADAERQQPQEPDAQEQTAQEQTAQGPSGGEGAGKKKKKKKRRKDMTPEERKKRTKRDLIITGCVFGAIALFAAICAVVSYVGWTGNFDYIATIEAVEYDSEFTLIDADKSATGYYEFVAESADDEFHILHLTDIHLGAGPFSAQQDRWAIDAVETVVKRAAQDDGLDLVVVTGDLGFPVPYASGTLNNLREIEMFGELMASLDVYWTVVFGNHDTEIYSLYNREEVSDYFTEKAESGEWGKFLYRRGEEELSGFGNDIIVVRHPERGETITAGKYNADTIEERSNITQALVMLDSHSYTDGDYFGIAWKYDNIHQDQIDWYAEQMQALSARNGSRVKNMLFFHIPLREYGRYWEEYKDNGHQDTANVKYVFGKAGESGEKSFPGVDEDLVFETAAENGCQAIFCGHDHYNTYAIDVTAEKENGEKVTIRLEYGMSIDYIAYPGISGHIEQRGGAQIKISPDGSFSSRQRPYQEESVMEYR